MFSEWLRETVEWRNWGMNTVTLSFIATIFFTALSGWSLVKQNRTIGESRSGESVSAPLFVYLCGLFFAFLYYGIATYSLAPVINGLLGFLYIPVLLNLRKFKGFTRTEKALVWLCPLMVVGIIVVPWKDVLMIAIFGGAAAPLIHQLYELWDSKKPGAVDIRYISVFFVSTTFWTIYAYAAGNLPLKIINPPALVVLAAMMFLWFKYHKALAGSTEQGPTI